ncbi:LOW QUALITY PROTEIN: hypothetical protein TorRG33x02_211550 [Trema orientale]|uniref:Transmembrane protein n=1 Tax=Trema orientale TaxID=63057 RepID=A0A2P5EBZ4_TREOI|nr:LOW QUALITY PROTEIN: hypothetical protein TorRG33x02_211550 [Trema orientale]
MMVMTMIMIITNIMIMIWMIFFQLSTTTISFFFIFFFIFIIIFLVMMIMIRAFRPLPLRLDHQRFHSEVGFLRYPVTILYDIVFYRRFLSVQGVLVEVRTGLGIFGPLLAAVLHLFEVLVDVLPLLLAPLRAPVVSELPHPGRNLLPERPFRPNLLVLQLKAPPQIYQRLNFRFRPTRRAP